MHNRPVRLAIAQLLNNKHMQLKILFELLSLLETQKIYIAHAMNAWKLIEKANGNGNDTKSDLKKKCFDYANMNKNIR